MNQRTRKLMTLHKPLHPKDKGDRLYVSRKKEEEDLLSLKTVLTHQYNDFKIT